MTARVEDLEAARLKRRAGGNGSPPAPPRPDDRPTIQLGTDLHRVVDDATRALRLDQQLFQRDRALVHVVGAHQDRFAAEGTPQIRPVATATLRERLTRVADWEKYDGRSKDCKPAIPTDAVVGAVHARGEWPGVRHIVGVIECPTLRPDGTVLAVPGHDDATGYLYAPGIDFPPVPPAPTQDDARVALAELQEVFVDFPWRGPADRDAAVAAVLTMVARPGIAGAVPAFVFDKNTRGAGGTLLSDVCTIIPYGRAAAKMTWPHDNDEEVEKILGAYAMRGAAVVVFDNLTSGLGGGPLDRSLTAEDTVALRVLGRSEAPELRWRTVILATGNNVEVRGDTCRRVLMSRLESPDENPEDRRDFRHPDLRSWVRNHRARLVVAALTLLRAHALAGRPSSGCPTWGSFESWSAIVPAAIVWAGGADPMVTRPTVGGEGDGERGALLELVTGWARLAPEGCTARTAVEILYPAERLRGAAPPDGYNDLREAIEGMVTTPAGKAPSPIKLGHALKRFRRRVVDGRMLDAVGGHAGVMKWGVVPATQPRTGGVGGHGGVATSPSRREWQANSSVTGGNNPTDTTNPTTPSPEEVAREADAEDSWRGEP